METKLCRICGKTGQNFLNIFKTEELKLKIETCLPIIVSPHCLLPETICPSCKENIENFYLFTKTCLQNIIILETQLDIQESCLKTKRKKDKGCWVSLSLSNDSKTVQTEDYLNVLLGESGDFDGYGTVFPLTSKFLSDELRKSEEKGVLVDYEVLSDSNSENGTTDGQVVYGEKLRGIGEINNLVENILNKPRVTNIKKVFGGCGANLINEIVQRKSLKRKSGVIEKSSTKICRFDLGSRRKRRQPKKVQKTTECLVENGVEVKKEVESDDFPEENMENSERNGEKLGSSDIEVVQPNSLLSTLPQMCLLCDTQHPGPAALASHFMEFHAKQFIEQETETPNGDRLCEKKRKDLPNLVKISDLKRSDSTEDNPNFEQTCEDPPTLVPSFVCPNCPAVFTNKNDLMLHLKLKHSDISTYFCGICLFEASSLTNLTNHLQVCAKNHPISKKYYCQVCYLGDDNVRNLESHVLMHSFLLDSCRKEVKNFDPEDYIERNNKFEVNGGSPFKNLSCLECSKSDFESFKSFSAHRRNAHSIFHCDLCNKFYGRNSHLWKHVNRLHKGHPSVTCQMCFKTSASKYHLAQHFTKIHQTKPSLKKEESFDDFLTQKFEGFDFQSVKQSFLKQDLLETERKDSEIDDNSTNQFSDQENEESMDVKPLPKEIDPSHDLYTNIITNYTPPTNEGDFKCPKCTKGFHKKMLLKKHKKNCRPKMQKDLLTRCKSCARIFKDRQSLAKHLVNYHSDYICEICNEKFQSKCEIVSHIRFQHPSSHLVCSVCENILRCRKDLLEHLGDHENSYVCQFCGDTLSSKVKLKMHILSLHRKILSLSCGICLKLFENQHVLRDHVTLAHKDQLDPLTSCPVCGKNYGSKWKTYDHLNKSHGRIFRACKICLEIYETEGQLEAHTKMAHANQQPPSTGSVRPNPAAILNAAGNHGNNGNSNLTLNNNRSEFGSDSEGHDSEESDDSKSEDEEEDEEENFETKESKRVFGEHFMAYPNQENKISLLEKRLLGKKITQDETKQVLANNTTKIYKNIVEQKKEKELPIIKKEEDSINTRSDANHLTNHSKRTVYVNSNDPSFCEICHKTWPAKKHLWQHYIRCHKSVAATVCGICLKTNEDYENLQMHLKETHPTLLHGQGFGSNFICRICGRYHNASSKLKLHMVIHENFDWTLLNRFPTNHMNRLKNPLKENGQKNGGRTMEGNGFKYERAEVKQEQENMKIFNGNDEIFDDMIEQVEESSSYSEIETKNEESSSDDDDTRKNYEPRAFNDKNSSQSQPAQTTFNNILQTLKNNAKSPDQDSSKVTNNVSVISDNFSNNSLENNLNIVETTLSEESSSSLTECEKEGQNSQVSESDEDGECSQGSSRSSGDNLDVEECRNIFRPKPEELDSAIKSISYSCPEPQIVNEFNDFCEIQPNSLNETEIESAVGSIL